MPNSATTPVAVRVNNPMLASTSASFHTSCSAITVDGENTGMPNRWKSQIGWKKSGETEAHAEKSCGK